MLPPKQQRRPLPFLLALSVFNGSADPSLALSRILSRVQFDLYNYHIRGVAHFLSTIETQKKLALSLIIHAVFGPHWCSYSMGVLNTVLSRKTVPLMSSISKISCLFSDYAGQDLLDFGAGVLCPTYFPEGQDCMLPLNPGKYGGGEPLTITLGDIPDILGILQNTTRVFLVFLYFSPPDMFYCFCGYSIMSTLVWSPYQVRNWYLKTWHHC